MYTARVLGRRYVTRARDTVEVRVTRCLSSYIPGQYVRVYIECNDPKRFREMNITSLPEDEHLSFAFRVSDSIWKRAAMMLKPMDEVSIRGPYGLFLLPEEHARVAMLAHGIGITPFMSMIRHVVKTRMHEVALLYINHDRDHAPYIDELEHLVCSNFRLFEFFSNSLDIKEWIGDMQGDGIERWYISGEPRYVRAVRQLLVASGIDTARISVEEFSGYCP
ncbi:MAG: FAD-dependent oxidoreductase [Candidatus Nitrosocaldus sp.]|nr:FAD-dependent oxidoreductase [Candidatus Nitrosocaldus sp.]MDW7999405.1 FAD-dependent oxidoreductase [Candidatus Nitrosocaldus sp.]MDW8274989.1 FAD-dependent oxidoreductase [Candidatus Nitrosocaldus sp.]